MWDIDYFYDFTFLMKNQVSHRYQLVDLLKFYKITDSNSKKHDDTMNVNILDFSDETKWNK
ncbi:hypothetical protein GLOIN_2v1761635 [Rhizophagus irregularis DAOM 181602=DAOM 197198]|nr:hypothetical protein GLOIN_2v1761635 [Rhizophagus irregularis DAOM 181602=DAOM 197198]